MRQSSYLNHDFDHRLLEPKPPILKKFALARKRAAKPAFSQVKLSGMIAVFVVNTLRNSFGNSSYATAAIQQLPSILSRVVATQQ